MSTQISIVALTERPSADEHAALRAHLEAAGVVVEAFTPLTFPGIDAVAPGGQEVPVEAAGPYTAVLVEGSAKESVRELRSALNPDPQVQALPGYDVVVLERPKEKDAGKKRMLIMDVDSTLIGQEAVDELAAHAGLQERVAAITERAMRGELDFQESLRERVALLEGLGEDVLERVAAALTLTPGARELIAAFKAQGHPVCVVSGGFIQILEPLARRLNLDHARANLLGVEDGRLTGEVSGQIIDADVKAASLREWAKAEDVDLDRVIAVGDGANDRFMLERAGLGVAFQAKPALRETADAQVTLRRLDAVRHFAGL
ncbi:phosphoserine phosphatase SerB [Rothia sp. AR01]|uniref:phosphoserine phosphatase n=1 Tax=Rothia santali TaxID=2949643 RepID=A0A9X2KGV2_9MICC|nr:phosphoserine phosphatase SerB [Rothia santali]MCP3424523.1 phosphoserine phosphatase SerB [Rothia santali]